MLDIPSDSSTNRILRPPHENIGPKATGGFLGDNWDWYWNDVSDEDWIRADLQAGYEYTFDVSVDSSYPEKHQATDLKIMGIHDPDDALIDDTASAGTGKRVSVVFRPDSDGRHYVSVGSGENDRTGDYDIRVSARLVE